MDIERTEFRKRLEEILGLVKTLEIAIREESEKLSLQDINELADIIETQLTDTVNLLKS